MREREGKHERGRMSTGGGGAARERDEPTPH